ncbi:MAG: zf-HC2 domain-containing protein, partial [Planctomycetota bacterium]|nr:zf-HC2 domain-containing protein [Planctomycetota bacterium]
MLCEQARDHLSAYLDRELASELSSAVRAHLESCADCRALLADLRATVGLLGRLPVHRAPADLADDVQREVERCTILPAAEHGYDAEPQERTLALRRVRLWPRALAVAASLLLVVGIGVLALLGPAGGPETVPVLSPPAERGPEVAKDGEIGGGVGSAAALAKKEAVGDYKAADRRKGGALEGKEGGWGGGRTDLAKVPERARAGPSGLEHVSKAPGPDSLAEDADRGTRLRAAEKPSGDELAAVQQVQRAMNLAANGEVPIDELKQVATVDNLRRAGGNTLVIETDAPAEANKDLTRLFLANDWQPVAPPPAVAGARVEELGKAVDKGGAPARVAARPARAAAPNGYYFLAHSDGEYVWVVVADRDYITRFSSQLAADERLRVGNESGRQFQAIRTLQDEVRQYNLSQSQVVQGGGGTAGREVRYAGKAAAPVATGDSTGRTAAPAVPAEAARPEVISKLGTAQVTVGKAYAPTTGQVAVQPSQAAEPAPAAPELTRVQGEKDETPAATQAIPTLERPALAKEPAGPAPAPAGGEQ